MNGCGLLTGEVIPLGFEPKTHSLEGITNTVLALL